MIERSMSIILRGHIRITCCSHRIVEGTTRGKKGFLTTIEFEKVRRIHTSNGGSGRRAKATPKASTSSLHQSTMKKSDYLPSSSTSSSTLIMSTVERGTTYEEHVKSFLQKTFPKMDLMRIGGAHDGGIDLTGWWWSPLDNVENLYDKNENNDMESIRITVQCKSEARKLGPRHIREIHGTMITKRDLNSISNDDEEVILPSILDSIPFSTTKKTKEIKIPSMAILASSSGFSKQCILQALSAPFPLLLIHLLFPEGKRSKSSSFDHPTIVANDALLDGLLQSQLEVRWSSSILKPELSKEDKRKKSIITPTPIKIDLPSLYLGGKKLSN